MTAQGLRAVVVLDDAPVRVATAVTLLQRLDPPAPSSLHVVCSTARAAERMEAAVRRLVVRSVRPRGSNGRSASKGVVVDTHRVHVLGGLERPARIDDCCILALDWLFELIRGIAAEGRAIDAVAGPGGVLRAQLLRGALETAGSPHDRLFLHRMKRSAPARAGHSRPADGRHALLLVPHLPPHRRDAAGVDGSFSALLRRRQREWRAGIHLETVVVDGPKREIRVGNTAVALTPDQIFWYAALATRPGQILPVTRLGTVRRVNDAVVLPADVATTERASLQAWLDHLRDVFGRLQPRNQDRFAQKAVNAFRLPEPQLRTMVAKIGRALRLALGESAERYRIQARRGQGYLLDLQGDLIRVVLPSPPDAVGRR